MFADRCNDWDVVFGVGRIEKRVETAGPGGDLSRDCQNSGHSSHGNHQQSHHGFEKNFELACSQLGSDILHKGVNLTEAEYTKSLKGRRKV